MGGPAIVQGIEYKEFDNFYPCVFYSEGVKFTSSEQYFQYQKASYTSEDESLINGFKQRILETDDPLRAWEIGQKVPIHVNTWEIVKASEMWMANLLKFSQNYYLRSLLADTYGDDIQCYASDDFWNKKNSKILESIRKLFL